MKAIVLKEPGGIENLLQTNLPVPVVNNNEVLVKVKAISINPIDTIVRKDARALKNFLKLENNDQRIIIGWDISGTVIEKGKIVSSFKKGDEVFGLVKFPGHAKAYAEYVRAPENQIAVKPTSISHSEAAAASLAALTAGPLVTYAKVKEGDKVLIHGAAGGVGHYAVQIAKYFAACIIGTACTENQDFVLNLGADEFIDYKNKGCEDVVKDADVVPFGLVPKHVERSLDAMRYGGRLVSLLGSFDESFNQKMKAKEIFAHRHVVHSNGEDMKQIAALLGRGAIKSCILQTYAFDEVPKAHQKIESGKTRGKVVVHMT